MIPDSFKEGAFSFANIETAAQAFRNIYHSWCLASHFLSNRVYLSIGEDNLVTIANESTDVRYTAFKCPCSDSI